ncbi:type II secretion system minor pseudopilin GspH [Escherichia coli]|nr:type II secretion system minor pseudopilin GspH [Escherichia coli]
MKQHGFTLLELILVILLIGCVTSLVLMLFPVPPQEKLQRQRDRLQAQLEFALDTSQQDGVVLGLQIQPQSWEFKFLQRQQPERNTPVTGSDIWQSYVWQTWQTRRAAMGGKLPDGISLELQLQGLQKWLPASDKEVEPEILLLPGGEATPFTLLFRLVGSEVVVGLRGDEDGVIDVFENELAQ